MPQQRAPALVVVSGGVAETYAPAHVDVRLVDMDNIRTGDAPPTLPAGVGFERLCEEAGLEIGKEVMFEGADIATKLAKPVEGWCVKCDQAFEMTTAVARCPECGQLIAACEACTRKYDMSTDHCNGCHGGSHFTAEEKKPASKPRKRRK